MKSAEIDVIGAACVEYFSKKKAVNITVESSVNEKSIIPVPYLFRDFDEMPEIEKVALLHCRGKVLEIGAGVGSHALELQNKNLQVLAVDHSPGCCEIAKARGVKEVLCEDFLNLNLKGFDTILLMMNGIGVCGSLKGLDNFLIKAKSELAKGAQLIFDSCDILYMFLNDDGSLNFNLNGAYYGEVEYKMSYKKWKGNSFQWLFIDEGRLKEMALKHGFTFTKLFQEEEGMYLVSLGL